MGLLCMLTVLSMCVRGIVHVHCGDHVHWVAVYVHCAVHVHCAVSVHSAVHVDCSVCEE